jgi:hypothetical protein
MTYRPVGAISYGPPLRERLPSLLYLAFALSIAALIVVGQNASSGSALFQYVVEGDRHRILPASACGILLVASALAAVIRTAMRGVIVHPDGIEMRELLTFGWPRVRRVHWSQIDRVTLKASKEAQPKPESAMGIVLDLWNGERTWLPEVANALELALTLEKVALARAIPLDGSTGQLDDLGNPFGDEAED